MNAEKRRTLRLATKSAVFCGLLLALMSAANFVLMPPAVLTDPWPAVKTTRGEVDVVALGSSRTYCTFMPMEAWRRHGVTALDVTAAVQPVSVSLAYLEELLKSHQPKVVMLELYMVGQTADFDAIEAHTSLDRMPRGVPRSAAIFRSVEPAVWFEMFNPLQAYHSRWPDVRKEDFAADKDVRVAYARGAAYISDGTTISPDARALYVKETSYRRDMGYIRRMAELCESADAELLLFTSPTPWRPQVGDDHLLVRLKRDLSNDYPRIRYLDMGAVEPIGLDPATDFKDELHVNFRGAVKASAFLTDYIKREYGLRDHRDSSFAGRWNDSLQLYDAVFRPLR